MTDKNGSIYEFGGFVLDRRQNLLMLDGGPVHIPAKTYELLTYFIRYPNKVIDKETLMIEIWHDAFVEDANLSVHISNLRKILAAAPQQSVSIETFPKVGYRFNADVNVVANGAQTNGAAGVEVAKKNGSEKIIIDGDSSPLKRDPAISQRRVVAIVLTALIAIAASGYVAKRFFDGRAFGGQTIERVRGTEQSSAIAISPTGEYLAHTISRAGKRSLMMTNIGSNSSVQLLPPDEALYYGMTFTKDSSFLYFVKSANDALTLYKIPVLGNTATKILDNVGQKISFSPNGDRFCFVRKVSGAETAIVVANADGRDERIIATRKAPQYFSQFEIAWSPNGKLIANAAGIAKESRSVQIIGVDVETGAERLVSDTKWTAGDGLEWMADGSGIIAGLFETGNSPTQVWFIPYPSGEPRKITNDLNNYGGVGVSSDGRTIMAGQFKDESSLWVVPIDQPAQSQPVTTARHHLFRWVRWTPDGRLLFGSSVGENRDIWIMNADGSGETQLTANSAANVMPTATADGRFVVFASSRGEDGAYHLWRAGADGSDPVQLTRDVEALQPDTTPDGRWIFYTSGKMDAGPLEKSIWKVSIDGGEPARFIAEPAHAPDISPDGKFVLCWFKPNNETPWTAAIFPIDGGRPITLLDIKPGTPIHWTADGKGVSYIKTVDAVANIWTQPINGGSPKQTTGFTSEGIFNFDWSNDGRLICSRISKTRDVVLVRNFR